MVCCARMATSFGRHFVGAFVAHLVEIELQGLRVRYRLGQSLREASAREGGRALFESSTELRAAGLRLDASALRKIRKVASVMREDEFEELLELRSSGGLPLKWSHLESLSIVRSRSGRAQMARRILAAGVLRCRAAAAIARKELVTDSASSH